MKNWLAPFFVFVSCTPWVRALFLVPREHRGQRLVGAEATVLPNREFDYFDRT